MKPGWYTRLTRNGSIIMSDTPDEIRDHWDVIRRANGRVLINGLGLGVVLNACLSKVLSDDGTSAGREMAVEHATVVEKNQDVIDLVGSYYEDRFGDRLTIVHADALEWKAPRGERYNVVWHDIWDDICADNLDSMKKLHRKYGRRCDWQGSWCRHLCERQKELAW
jgi:spermidine synthase